MSQNTVSRNTALPVDYVTTDGADSDSEISFDQQRVFYRRSNNASPASSAGLSYHLASRYSPLVDVRRSLTVADTQQQLNNHNDRNRNLLGQNDTRYTVEQSDETRRLSEFSANADRMQRRGGNTDCELPNNIQTRKKTSGREMLDTSEQSRGRPTDNSATQIREEDLNREMQNNTRVSGDFVDITDDTRHPRERNADTRQLHNFSAGTGAQPCNLGIPNNDQTIHTLPKDMQHRSGQSANFNGTQACEREIQFDAQRFGEPRLTENDVRRLSELLRGADDTPVCGRVTNRDLQSETRERSRGFGRGMPSYARQPNSPSANCGAAGVHFGNVDCELRDDMRHVRGNPIHLSGACSNDDDPSYGFQNSAQRLSDFNTDARKVRGSSADTRGQDSHPTRDTLTSYQDPSPQTWQGNNARPTTEDHYPSAKNKRHAMKPGKFDGKMPLETFLRQFDICAKHNSWDDGEKADYLQCALEGNPAQLLWEHSSGSHVTYDGLVARLRQRYGVDGQAASFRSQLSYRRQKNNESLHDLFHDIKRLLAYAFPSETSAATETIACDSFIQALSDRELAFKVKEKEPETVDDAFKIAVRLQAYQEMRDDERDRMRTVRDSREARFDLPANYAVEQFGQMWQVEGDDQRQWRRPIENRVAVPSFPRKGENLPPSGEGRPNRQSDNYRRPAVRFNENEASARYGRQQTAASSNDIWYPAPRREDGTWYVPNDVENPNNFTTARSSHDGGRRTTPNDRQTNANQSEGGRRCYGCGSFSHLRRDCPRARGSQRFVSRINNSTSGATADDRNATSYYLRTIINNHSLLSLLDSGSDSNILPARYAEGVRLYQTNKTLLVANGTRMDIVGECILNVRLANQVSTKIKFIVSETVADVILGSGFLRGHQCLVDYGRGILHWGRRRIHLTTKQGALWARRIQVVEPIVLEPMSQNLIPSKVLIGNSAGLQNGDWLLENTQIQPGVYIARSVYAGSASDSVVEIVNLNNRPVGLRGDQVLGDLQPVEVASTLSRTVKEGNPDWGTRVGEMIRDIPEDVSDSTKWKLGNLLVEYKDVFSQNEFDLGRCDIFRHTIDTGDAKPVRQPLRRHPPHYQRIIDDHVDTLLKQGVVVPAQSAWASNVVLVKKKDQTMRFCVDMRAVNLVTKFDTYPLPLICECLDSLAGAAWYSTIDLASGYFQIALDERDSEKTAFVTRRGVYKFTTAVMGLKNSSMTTQRNMDIILSGLNFLSCLVYLDDVIIFSTDPESHVDRLREVFGRLRAANLKIKPSKCRLMQKEVAFLGHRVSANGISPDPEKVSKVKNWPVPRNLKDLRSFLGGVSYYRKYIRGFSEVALPLTSLTRKNRPFSWTPECQNAFEKLKLALISAPILGLPRDEGQYVLDTDASSGAIGAVLSQVQDGVERVVAYGGRTLNNHEMRYSVTRKELTAVVHFARVYKPYLLGRHFLIRTDHAALSWLLTTKEPLEGQNARWLEYLGQFSFDIEHRAGTKHGNADFLSRPPTHGYLVEEEPVSEPMTNSPDQCVLEQVLSVYAVTRGEDSTDNSWGCSLQRVRDAQAADPIVSQLRQWVVEGPPDLEPLLGEGSEVKTWYFQREQIELRDDLVYRRHPSGLLQLVIPRSLRTEFLNLAHSGISGGHLGVRRTRFQVRRRAYWTGWSRDVKRFVECCERCQRYIRRPLPHNAEMLNIKVGEPNEFWSIDLTGPHVTSRHGHRYIFTATVIYSRPWTVLRVMSWRYRLKIKRH